MNNISQWLNSCEYNSDIDGALTSIVRKAENGEIITLGGILFLIYGNEIVSLVGGSYSKFMEFQSAYTIHFEGMKMAIEQGYERYNFYGITGDFREENPLFGLYSFNCYLSPLYFIGGIALFCVFKNIKITKFQTKNYIMKKI